MRVPMPLDKHSLFAGIYGLVAKMAVSTTKSKKFKQPMFTVLMNMMMAAAWRYKAITGFKDWFIMLIIQRSPAGYYRQY